MEKERRFAAYVLSHPDLVMLLGAGQGAFDCIEIPTSRNIPKDASIVNVSYEGLYNGWVIIFEHESFDALGAYAKVPVIGGLALNESRETYVRRGCL